MDEKGDENDSHKKKVNKSENTNIDGATEASGYKVNVQNNFIYLSERDSEQVIAFSFSKRKNLNNENINDVNNIYSPDNGLYKYAICILLRDDQSSSSALLEQTLKGIKKNLKGLKKFDIEPKDIMIFVFVNQINKDHLIKKESIKEHLSKENKQKYLKTPLKYKIDDSEELKIDIICKRYYMSEVESLRCFYYYILNSLKADNKIIITSVITAGVVPIENGLKNLIEISFSGKNTNKRSKKNSLEYNYAVAVPALEVKDDNLYTKIAQYERVHFNIYTMNFYNKTAAVPVSSLLNTMFIDKKLLADLHSFYSITEINASIDYHDYNLGLFLHRSGDKIFYYSQESLGKISYINLDFNEYQDIWINKYSGYYGNFFAILNTFTFCNNPSIDSKFFMFFQIIGLIIEFIYPGLSLLVIYSVFIEAFGVTEIYSAAFITILYLIMYLGSGVCLLMVKKSKEIQMSNFFLYGFMEVYYLFILICSIPAMDNINKGKNISPEVYKFNKGACAVLIIFTFIIAIIPLLMRVNMVKTNIVQMFIYLFLGAPSSTSLFLLAKIWKAPETSGGTFIEEKKGITIIVFFLSNLFFGCLCFFNYNTKLRANCVMGLAIFYLIYLFFKVAAILFPLLSGPTLGNKSDAKIKNELENPDANDVEDPNELKNSNANLRGSQNEEKLDDDDNNNNDDDNNNNDDDNNNNDDDNNNDGDNNNDDNNNNDGDNNNDDNNNEAEGNSQHEEKEEENE